MKILVILPNAPGSGHRANGLYLANGFSGKGHEVSILETNKNEDFFTNKIVDVVIFSGDDKISPKTQTLCAVLKRCNIKSTNIMHFPPPNCAHICHPAYFKGKGAIEPLDLPEDIPYQMSPIKFLPSCAAEIDALIIKERGAGSVRVMIAYLSVSNTNSIISDLEKHLKCKILMFNFGKLVVPKAYQMEKVSQSEFQALLSFYRDLPFLTDGANSIGAAQACGVPYFDMSMRRVLENNYRPSLKKIVSAMGHHKLKNPIDFKALKLLFEGHYWDTAIARGRGRFALVYDLFMAKIGPPKTPSQGVQSQQSLSSRS